MKIGEIVDRVHKSGKPASTAPARSLKELYGKEYHDLLEGGL